MGDQRALGVAYPADQIVGLAERAEQLLAGAAGSGAGGFGLPQRSFDVLQVSEPVEQAYQDVIDLCAGLAGLLLILVEVGARGR